MAIRNHRALLTALGLGVVLWFGSAVVHAAWTRAAGPTGLVGLVAPTTPAVSLVRGAGSAGGSQVLATIAFLAVLAALVLPAVRATRTGAAARVLAAWFAVIVAGWAAATLQTLATIGMFRGYAIRDLLALGVGEPVRTGWAWGVSYGWVVALATVAVARRSEQQAGGEQQAGSGPALGAPAAAVTAGVVAAIGWLVAALAHVAVDDTVNQYVTTARSQFALSVRVSADWLLPVTTAGGAPGGVVLLGALLVGAVVGTLAWLAARTTVLQGGRLVLFLGVWAAAIVGAVVGGLPTALASTGLDPEGDGRWAIGQGQLYGPSDGGAAGAFYGWIPALLVVGLLVWTQRRVPAVEPSADTAAHA
ncbi:hypothetical protein [Cellulomonas fengjieae]|uniref:hypothetical protein n=1 Tax=Cellulomonas fengjieae TaxID=2819978 RepID=UPI001AAEA7F8|nr:hypothetical protein [Cellulomonas fengjieae]MBO3102341.1 hypothetical protein [Cellulomonas fengjieae]